MLRWVGLLGVGVSILGSAAEPASVELWQAERTFDGQRSTVDLPDTERLAPGATGPVRAQYRLRFRIDDPAVHTAVLIPGLIGQARIGLNGRLLDEPIVDPMRDMSSKWQRIRSITLPRDAVVAGGNVLDIDLAGARSISLSSISVGDRAAIERRQQLLMFASIVGPAVIAVVVATVALCLLLLWVRRHDPLYAYFGLGALGWALHSLWFVFPDMFVAGVHRDVWWNALYAGFVLMLVIFCVRLAGWQWRRFEQSLIAATILGGPLLYAAHAYGALNPAAEYLRLATIAVVGIGLAAVGRYAWTHRTASGALLVVTGGISLAFGVRDWLVGHSGRDNNPVYLVPYAGLPFVVLVAWMLIDRFVDASRKLETVNQDLERRVDAKSAQLTQAVEAMRHAKDTAEAANRSKSSFLAAASHDLRQPIHALGLYMAALGGDRMSADQHQVLDRMQLSLGSLETMFDALLDVSRMDAGAVVPERRAFDLGAMLRRLADEHAPLATDKGLRLSVRIGPAPDDLHALSDALLVERIVRNLLGNAVKYTLDGGVLLSCRWRGDAQGHWRIEIWDTGPGIPRAERERVFEEFVQIGNPERDRARGLGLGLSIVRRLCELLGHPLTMTSVADRGTRFMLDLPATRHVQPPGLPPPKAPTTQATLAGLGVAVIDDDAEVRDAMRLLLERWGCRVYAAADAAQLLDDLRRRGRCDVHAIVADWRLRDGRNGADAIAELRAAFGRPIPAVIVSGDSSPQELTRMHSSGFKCLSKPVASERLRGWLGSLTIERRTKASTAGGEALP
ncbi:MAG: ATP-binding protein [Burkholderiaceae bacterium]